MENVYSMGGVISFLAIIEQRYIKATFGPHVVINCIWFLSICIAISNFFPKLFETKIFKMLSKNAFYIYLFHDPLEYIVLRFAFHFDWLTTNIGCYLYVFLRIVGVIFCSILFGKVTDWFICFEKYKIMFFSIIACLFLVVMHFCYNSFLYPLKLKRNVAENGKVLYDSENVSVYLCNDSLYYITTKKNDSTKKYFLHFHTDDKQAQEKIKNGFVNRDFSFSNCEMRLPFWSRHRMAVVEIPDDFYITKIDTGQFEGKTRFWQTNVPVYEYFDDIRNFSLVNLTDKNWSHGFHRKSNILLVKSNDISYKYLIGKTIELPDGSQAKITNVRREGQYYHIHTDKYLMIDSNNVPIKIIEEAKPITVTSLSDEN